MPVTPAQIAIAEAAQYAAAHSTADQVRLVAGPGTGKSSAIVERIRWLEGHGQDPALIAAETSCATWTRLKKVRIRLISCRSRRCTENVGPSRILVLWSTREAGDPQNRTKPRFELTL